jgi:hypothetical protein
MIDKEKGDDVGYHLGEMGRVYGVFKNILRENDKLYNFKVGFTLAHTAKSNYYKIEVYPMKEGFDSRQYFIDNFENEKGLEKLAEFADRNNVGLITY